MTGTFESTEAMAQRSWDELSIMRTLANVARAQDSLDTDAYQRCFTDRVLLTAAVMFADWKPKAISARELARMTIDALSKYDHVHHMVFNHVIDVQGAEATCEADLYAVSLLTKDGATVATTIGGRYTLRLRRLDGEWLISERGIAARYQFESIVSLPNRQT
jgi:hypothetical protein